jgi:hypothetical protein
MESCSFDNKEAWGTLSTSQTLLPDDAVAIASSLDTKGITAWLDEDDAWPAAPRSRPAADPSLGSGHRSSDRVLLLRGEAGTVHELLSHFMVSEWPAEVHLAEPDRFCATMFLDFVAVKVEARVMASLRGLGTELVFTNNSTSPDTVLFGNLVHACERHLRSQLGELPEGSLMKDELLEEDLFSELEDEEFQGAANFQALLAELVHCSSARTREELLQALAQLAGNPMARLRLAEAFCSPIGIFAVGFYLKPEDEAALSLAETYPFAYVLRQAASRDESGEMALLKGLVAHATQNASSQLVARELELALSFLPEGPNVEEGEDIDDDVDDGIPTRSVALTKSWRVNVQDDGDDGAGPSRTQTLFRAPWGGSSQ